MKWGIVISIFILATVVMVAAFAHDYLTSTKSHYTALQAVDQLVDYLPFITSTPLPPSSTTPPVTTRTPPDGGTGHVLLGAHVQTNTGGIPSDSVLQGQIAGLESSIGRPIAIDNESVAWASGDPPAGFPDMHEINWDIAHGSIPMQSWMVARSLPRGNTDQCATADDIIAGKYDAQLIHQAGLIKTVPTTVLIRFNAETASEIAPCFYDRGSKIPNNDANSALLGPLYVGAWKHVVDIFRAQGVKNVEWIWAPGTDAYADTNNAGTGTCAPDTRWTYYYPGDTYVDWIAVDHYQKDGSKSLSIANDTCFKNFYDQVAGKGKPLMMAETGANSNPALNPDPQTLWIQSLEKTLPAEYPLIRAVLWWDGAGSYYSQAHPGFPGSYDLTGTGLAAFKALANDPYFMATTLPK